MPGRPLVSVIVLAGADGAPIPLDSLRNQTYPEIELYVASRLEHEASSRAIERAIRETRGRYVTLFTADCRYHPERIASLVEHCEATGASLCFTLAELEGPEGDVGASELAFEVESSLSSHRRKVSLSHALLQTNPWLTVGNLFFSRGLFEKAGEFGPLTDACGLDFLCRAIPFAEPSLLQRRLLTVRLRSAEQEKARRERFRAEAPRALEAYLERAMASLESGIPFENPRAPHPGSLPIAFQELLYQEPSLLPGPIVDHCGFVNASIWRSPRLRELIGRMTGRAYEELSRFLRPYSGDAGFQEVCFSGAHRVTDVRSIEIMAANIILPHGTMLEVRLGLGGPGKPASLEQVAKLRRCILTAFEGDRLVAAGRACSIGPESARFLLFFEGAAYENHSERSWVWNWVDGIEPRRALLPAPHAELMPGSDFPLEIRIDRAVYRPVLSRRHGVLERFGQDGSALELSGWAIDPVSGLAPEAYLVCCGSRVRRVRAGPRPRRDDSAGARAGFEIRVPLAEALEPIRGGWPFSRIRLFALFPRGIAACLAHLCCFEGPHDQLSLVARPLASGSFAVFRRERETWSVGSGEAKRSWTLGRPGLVRGAIDRARARGRNLELEGWAMSLDEDEAVQACLVVLGGKPAGALLPLIERSDIQALFSLPRSPIAGFAGELELAGQDLDELEVHALLSNGKYAPLSARRPGARLRRARPRATPPPG